MTVRQGDKPLHVVIVCSLSAPDYQLVNNAAYPNIVADYSASIAKLRKLPCDIFLTPHGWDFDLAAKAKAVAAGHSDAFVDPAGYRRYLDKADAALRSQIAAQKARQSTQAPGAPAH
jgi:metallo-beta-lactamase class B